MPVPQQLPQIAILPVRHPDPRKVIFQQESQNQLRILPIRLLLADALRTDLRCVSNPQLELQFRQQPFKPARMPAGFHPHTNLPSLGREIAVELLRFLRVLQSPLLQFPSVGVHKSNLLEARMVIASYNPHVRLLSPGPWLVGTSKVYPGAGADIVMESISLINSQSGFPARYNCGYGVAVHGYNNAEGRCHTVSAVVWQWRRKGDHVNPSFTQRNQLDFADSPCAGIEQRSQVSQSRLLRSTRGDRWILHIFEPR